MWKVNRNKEELQNIDQNNNSENTDNVCGSA